MFQLQIDFFSPVNQSIDYTKSNLAVWLTGSTYYLWVAKSKLEFVVLAIDAISREMSLVNANPQILESSPVALFSYLQEPSTDVDCLHISSEVFRLTYASETFNFTELTALLLKNSKDFCAYFNALSTLSVYGFASGKFHYRETEKIPQGFQHVFVSDTDVMVWKTCCEFYFPYSLSNYTSKFLFSLDRHLNLEVSVLR